MQKVILILMISCLWLTNAWGAISHGKFQFFIDGTNGDAPLLTAGGSVILPADVPQVYGTPDGMTVFDDGVDVCSWEYVKIRNLMRPIKPVYQDLSDAAGWPDMYVAPDTLAIDPVLGRFKVSDGGTLKASDMSSAVGDSEVLIVTKTVDVPYAQVIRIVRKESGFPSSSADGVIVYEGINRTYLDTNLTNGVTYYYSLFFIGSAKDPIRGKVVATPQQHLGKINLIVNGDFEAGDTDLDGVGNNWGKWHLSNSNVTFRLSTAHAYKGSTAQEIYLGVGSSAGAFVKQLVQLKENTEYIAIVNLMATGNTTVGAYIDGFGSIANSVGTGGVYKEFIKEFKTSSNGGSPINAYFSVIQESSQGESVFVDNIILAEKANVAFDIIKPVARVHTGFGVPGHGAIKVQGNYAYMASGEGDFQIIDVADKTNPKVASYFPVEFNRSVEVLGSIAYIQGNNGIKTIDISNPDSPVYQGGTLQHPNLSNIPWVPSQGGTSMEIIAKNGFLYVTVSGSTTALYILDPSDPNRLLEVGSLVVPDVLGASGLYLNSAGNKAYLALNTGGVATVDISIPSAPSLLGTYILGPGEDPVYDKLRLIGVSGSTMIMSTPFRPLNYPGSRAAKIVLIDASNPAVPTRRGSYSFGSDANPGSEFILLNHAVGNGNYIYVADKNEDSFGDLNRLMSKTRLITFDITNLDAPVIANEYIQQKPGRFTKLSLYGQFLYVNDYNLGMHIFDVSTPANPVEVGSTVTAGEGHYAWVNDSGSLAFHTQTFGGSIYVVDVSNPNVPIKRGTYWDGEWNERTPFMGRGDYLYVPQRYDISIVDVSNPDMPIKIGIFPGLFGDNPENWPRISLFGKYAFVSTASRVPFAWGHYKRVLHIYDISSPRAPQLVSQTNIINDTVKELNSGKIFASGKFVYMTFPAANKFVVIDVSDPALPIIKGVLTDPVNLQFYAYHGEAAGRIVVTGDYAYVSSALGPDTAKQLHIIDISNPSAPTFVTSYSNPLQGSFRDIRVSGKYLYSSSYGGYHVYDILNPMSPIPIAMHAQYPWITGWSSGPILGDFLYSSSLEDLNIVQVVRDSQSLRGIVSVAARTTVLDITAPASSIQAADLATQATAFTENGSDEGSTTTGGLGCMTTGLSTPALMFLGLFVAGYFIRRKRSDHKV